MSFQSSAEKDKKELINILLPLDILLDIISRLPVESVLECKLVCKKWLKLLHARRSSFTNMHVSRQLNQLYGCGDAAHGDDELDMGILFGCTPGLSWEMMLFYGALYNDTINTDYMYEYKKTLKKVRHPPMNYKLPDQYLVGSCNGLVCLGRHHHKCIDPTYIYNPVTGEYVNLPKYIIPRTSRLPRIVRGFGYVPSTNEYKVVRIFYPSRYTVGELQVYTLGSGCGWRTKCITFPWIYAIEPASFVDGSLYWWDKLKICAFDLANEELRMVPSPPFHTLNLGSCGDDNFGLVVLRRKLCFFHQTLRAPHMEIWSLKKTDMNESWSKDFSIVYEKKEKYKVDHFWPIIITKNNKIIFTKNCMTIDCYDPETSTWKEMVAEDPDFSIESIAVISHVNTFVSLKALGGKPNKRSSKNKRIGQNVVSLA